MAEATPVITFIFKKNVYGLVFDGRPFSPRVEMREKQTMHGPAAVPYFFMDEPQEIPLKNEKVMLSKKPEGMSVRRFETITDSAYQVAEQHRIYNSAVRAELAVHVSAGNIEITSDPFALEAEPEAVDETDLEVALKLERDEKAVAVAADDEVVRLTELARVEAIQAEVNSLPIPAPEMVNGRTGEPVKKHTPKK